MGGTVEGSEGGVVGLKGKHSKTKRGASEAQREEERGAGSGSKKAVKASSSKNTNKQIATYDLFEAPELKFSFMSYDYRHSISCMTSDNRIIL